MSEELDSSEELDRCEEKEFVVKDWSTSHENEAVEEPTVSQEKEETVKVRVYSKLKPVHRRNESLLSNASGYDNYSGFKNLLVLLLVLTNLNSFLQNILKYGVLVDVRFVINVLEEPHNWPSVSLYLGSIVFIQICFFAELGIATGYFSELVVLIIHGLTCISLVVVPIFVGQITDPHPLFFTVTLAWYTILILKIVSYAMVNKWCREELNAKKEEEDSEYKPAGPVVYPSNVSMKDMYYFILAPTVCYELNFPRTEKINYYFVVKRSGEFLFFLVLMIASFQQWVIKTVNNSMKCLDDMDVPGFLVRLLTLSIPNHLIWLMFFFSFFHCFLNVVAELTRFGDRMFYRAWWNASRVQDFWANWNMPIHNWCKRHVYVPLLRNNFSKWTSMILVFLLSAFFHEFLVAVPLKMFKPWAFMGMLVQVPVAVLTNNMEGPWGNVIMWLSLILGQPLAILMYYHDWYVRETKFELLLNTTISLPQ